jgi:predicted TIM-barrel fold metal-dependent hydrolase
MEEESATMIDGQLVIDATTHAYNLADGNLVGAGGRPSRYAIVFREVLWGLHARCTPPNARVPREAFCTDWPARTLAETLFTESDVDLAVHHRLRLDSLFADGLCGQAKNDELARRWPHRFLTYAGVNPLDGVDACLRQLREQVERLPGTIGLKLYPDSGTPDRSWRMDDPQYAPLFDLAEELGLKVIAVHKVVPNGLTPLDPYRVDDLERVAIHHPGLAFEIVHAGLPPFVDEVTLALTRLPNVYANLEITSAFLERGFGVVTEALAQFIGFAGVDKILYASGGMHFHPQPIVDLLSRLELPDELLNRYRVEQLTPADRAAILGGNYARMVGLDLDAVGAGIAGDEFAAARARHGLRPPWSAWLAEAREQGLVAA